MKTRLTSLLLLAIALGSTSLITAATKDNAIAYPTTKIVVRSGLQEYQITRGDSRETVLHLLACPNSELTKDVWVYHGFSTDLPQANEQGCRTMIITFDDNKVVDILCVNKPANKAIAANLNSHPTYRNIAKVKEGTKAL